MKKPYTDALHNPIITEDVQLAIQVILYRTDRSISPMGLNRSTRFGIGKASNILTLLCDAGVVSKKYPGGYRMVLLRNQDQAINAALRQLKKGRK